MHRQRHPLTLNAALAAVLLAACSTDPAPAGEMPDSLGKAARCPVQHPCVPCGARGNELHVGEYCTKGGGECDDNGIGKNAILCAADFREDAPPFCTRACRYNSDCGSDAVCTGDPGDPKVPTACVPIACAAGQRGVEPDAGLTDTGTAATDSGS